MWVGIVSLFPEMFRAVTESGITSRAVRNGLLILEYWNPRDYVEGSTETNFRRVDDRPYGGGPGMVMQIEPLRRSITAARDAAQARGLSPKVIYLSPQGRVLDQTGVQELATMDAVILLCGRYEGIDERLIRREVDAEWSIGDYVLSGGEPAALVLLDAIVRLLPGVMGKQASGEEESFEGGLLEHPHYTKPNTWEGVEIPGVLLSGDHKAIARWKQERREALTRLRRPDLWETYESGKI